MNEGNCFGTQCTLGVTEVIGRDCVTFLMYLENVSGRSEIGNLVGRISLTIAVLEFYVDIVEEVR